MRGTTFQTIASVAALATGAIAADLKCVKGLHIIVARGTTEEPGTGITGMVADEIAGKISDSQVLALDYPASFTDPDYVDSEGEGATMMKKQILDYHKACPDGKMALMGYSQGAQLTLDAICGGSGNGFDTLEAVSQDIVDSSIVAITVFGDPSHIANVTIDRGTSINDGIFARKDEKSCLKYDDRLISYCDTGDVYCDSGNDSNIHGGYVQRHGPEIVKYIVDNYNNFSSGGGDSTATATGTATVTGTSTATGTDYPAPTVTATGTVTASVSATGSGSGSAVTATLTATGTGMAIMTMTSAVASGSGSDSGSSSGSPTGTAVTTVPTAGAAGLIAGGVLMGVPAVIMAAMLA